METSDLVIAEAVRQAIAATSVLVFAEVVDVVGGLPTVNLDGTEVADVQCVDGYTPTIGDRAWLLRQGGKLFAFGKQP